MCLILVAAYAVALAIPPLCEFFRLVPPGAEGIGCVVLGVAVAAAGFAIAGIRPGRQSPT
jgi:hypothetical protein